MEQKYATIGRNVFTYMGVNTHPYAIVRFRPDALNNKKMQEYQQLSQPFEMDAKNLLTCSDPHCAGNFFQADDETQWAQHLRYAHEPRPRSRSEELTNRHAGLLSQSDQALEVQKQATARLEQLEEKASAVREQLGQLRNPKPLRVKATAKA